MVPSPPSAFSWRRRSCWSWGGVTWQQCGYYADAEAPWRRTLAVNPGCWPAHYNLGVALVRQRDLDGGIVQFQEALQGCPEDAKSHNNLGSALMNKGQVDQALVEYQAALQTDPDFADAHDNLGSALLQKGRVDEAVAEYRKALRIKSDLPEAHNNLGLAMLQKGKLDDDIAECEEALRLDPSYADAHNNLGRALAEKGRPAEALVQFQRALELEPADSNTQNNLAWLLATCADASLRNGPRAVQLARQANDLADGRNPLFLHTLAAAFAEAGQFREATECAQKAIEVAKAAGQFDLASQLSNEVKRYEAGQPLHP